jgi:hypothetical protein
MNEMTAAVIELLADNAGAAGNRDYYGVSIDEMAPDGSEFDLTLTFKAGNRYCCPELGCHLAYSEVDWWRRLRDIMREHGLAHTPPMTIRKLRVVVEPGACLECRTDFGRGKLRSEESEGFTYETGPFAESGATY